MDNCNHQQSSDYIYKMFKSKEECNDDGKIETLKILLPYLSFNYRKNISILIKIMELKDTIEYFNNPKIEKYNSLPIPPTLKSKLLNSIRDKCSPDIQDLIDTWPLNSNNDNEIGDNTISSLISLLPTSQQNLFDNLEILQKIIKEI